jgi:hypothetical protein
VLAHSCPLGFYCDRQEIFWVDAKGAQTGTARRIAAVWWSERPAVALINVVTPQRKYRVERAN